MVKKTERVIELPVSGPLHPKVSSVLGESYASLYREIESKYELGELSRFFPMEGDSFGNRPDSVKLMVIGRCVNGWTPITEKNDEEFKKNAVTDIFDIGFHWLRDDGKAVDTYIRDDGKECRYNINRSAFWRSIKKSLNLLAPYTCDELRWFENIVWSNLYPIAPKDRYNADYNMRCVQLKWSREILLKQIEFYKPKHILFITDWEDWFSAFADLFPSVEKVGDSTKDIIICKGMYGERKVVVTIRPDRTTPFKPSEDVYAQEVYTAFQEIR